MPDPMHPRQESEIANAETHHEASDINVKAIVWFVVIFIAFAAVTHAGLWLLFRFYIQIGRGAAANAPMTSVARSVDGNIPALPRLQPFPSRDPGGEMTPPTESTPVKDMEQMRGQQDRELATYGWVDQGRGVVHIPIDEAKKLALESNLYAVNGGATAAVDAQPAGGGQSAAAGSTPVTTSGRTTVPPQP